MSSVAFPAYILGHDPTKRIIAISYDLKLAIKHHNDFRTVIMSPWYRDLFPETVISRTKNTETEVVTTRGGCRLATSIEGTLTGRGGDFLIVDDPLNAADALSDSKRQHLNDVVKQSLMSRLDDPQNGGFVFAMQRLHDDDPTGVLVRSSGGWTVLKLAAIAEQDEKIKIGPDEYYTRHAGDVLHADRQPRSTLDRIRAEIGADTFAAQYLQAPVPPGGVMIKREWVARHDDMPARSSSSKMIQSWDVAWTTGSESAWSVCTTWLIDGKFYDLIDVRRGPIRLSDLESAGHRHRPLLQARHDPDRRHRGGHRAARGTQAGWAFRHRRQARTRQGDPDVDSVGEIRERPGAVPAPGAMARRARG
jgi:hypothetical protein